MMLAVDVQYHDNNTAVVAGIGFETWDAAIPTQIYTTAIDHVAAYCSGQFYKRELPCLLALLKAHDLSPKTLIIDGYVYLDGRSKAGLGKYLYDALQGQSQVIGVAKKAFANIDNQYQLFRGNSKKPLYISCVGESLDHAKQLIHDMHGDYRIPSLLKKADQVCRGKG
ncbi:MAG: hypothetical protein KAG28_07700 [Cocleimonas sp.]|nr:hypothetical protein [Cocleimonas sp.]